MPALHQSLWQPPEHQQYQYQEPQQPHFFASSSSLTAVPHAYPDASAGGSFYNAWDNDVRHHNMLMQQQQQYQQQYQQQQHQQQQQYQQQQHQQYEQYQHQQQMTAAAAAEQMHPPAALLTTAGFFDASSQHATAQHAQAPTGNPSSGQGQFAGHIPQVQPTMPASNSMLLSGSGNGSGSRAAEPRSTNSWQVYRFTSTAEDQATTAAGAAMLAQDMAQQQESATAATLAELEGMQQWHHTLVHCLVCRETPRR
jgi:hypothetical protein